MALLDDVLAVPHLDLGLRFDVERMLEEVARIDHFAPYQSKGGSREHYARNWSGACLTSKDGDPWSDMTEHDVGSVASWQPTVLAELCPYLNGIAQQLHGTDRARVMRIAPSGSLHWHSHHQQHRQPRNLLTTHVPIVVPSEFRWMVMGTDIYRTWRAEGFPRPTPVTHNARYEPGRATIFNSYHWHNVINADEGTYRVSLMLYLNLNEPVVEDLVRSALDTYDGPRLRDVISG